MQDINKGSENMKKREQGVLTAEASIVLTLFTLFVLFLFSFGRVYRAQNVVSHATLQAADAVAIESYLRETAYGSDIDDVVYLSSMIAESASISADGLESLRTANLPKVAEEKFAAAISNTQTKANNKLVALGVKDGLAGVDFSNSTIDLNNDDVIVSVNYTIEMQFPVLGATELNASKSAKAKTFGEILFGVTTESNNSNWGSTTGDANVVHGATVEIRANPKYGYKFVKWDDGNTDNPRRVIVTEAHKFTAIFEKDGYGVNLSVNNPKWGKATGEGNYPYRSIATIKAIPESGYEFLGWDDNGDGKIDNTQVERQLVMDKTYDIKAHFGQRKYTIKVVSGNPECGIATVIQGNTISSEQIKVEYGSWVYINAEVKNPAIHLFKGWNNGTTTNRFRVQVTGDATYVANFEFNTYSVSFYLNKSDSSPWKTIKVIRGSSIDGSSAYIESALPTPKIDGRDFTGWVTATGSKFDATTVVNADMKVYGTWSCTVTYNANGGSVSPGSENVSPGESVKLPTPKRNGWDFTGWSSGGKTYGANSSVAISSHTTFVANWKCRHESGYSESTWHQFSCRAVHGAEAAKCEKCGFNCRPQNIKNSYCVKKCNGCGVRITQEDERKNYHYGINGYNYNTSMPMKNIKASGQDDFEGACNNTTHYFSHNGICYGRGKKNEAHDWGTYRHILCKYCLKVEQPGRDTQGGTDFFYAKWCGKHFDSSRKQGPCIY